MTLMLYPNKQEPVGWRLQDKVLDVQMYFPVSKYGSLEKAKEAGLSEEAELKKRRRYRDMRMSLDINQLFYPDGRVIGLRLGNRKTKDGTAPIIIAQVTVDKKQVSTSRNLKNQNFHDVYLAMQEWILEKRGIKRNSEITKLFKNAASRYRMY